MRRGSLLCRVVFGIPVTLIDPQHPQRFFARDNMYDYEDDFERCALYTFGPAIRQVPGSDLQQTRFAVAFVYGVKQADKGSVKLNAWAVF